MGLIGVSTAERIRVACTQDPSIDWAKSSVTADEYRNQHGVKGLAAMRRENPDLVFLDVQMPELDGFETFQEMAKDDALKNIPVVMLTGIKEKVGIGFSADEMKDYMGMKPAAYLEKPIDPVKVRETMKKILPL